MTTLDRIRRTAATLFAERGYAGTSMSKLAGEVGIRKASLYNYYPSKEALLQDLVDRGMQAWHEACHPLLSQPESPRERLRSFFFAIFDFVEAHPETVALIRIATTQIRGALGKQCRGSSVEEQGQMVSDVADLCQQAMDERQLAAGDARELALFWMAVVDGILINKMFSTPRSEEFGRHLEGMWNRLWIAMGGSE